MRYISMTVVNQDNTTQTFITIPRGYIDGDILTLRVRDEQTNVSLDYTPTQVYPNVFDLVYIDAELDCLYEAGFFELSVLNASSDILYKDRLFSTNQSIENYSINNNKYLAIETYNNDYIVIQ